MQQQTTNIFQACAQLAVEPIYKEIEDQNKCGLEALLNLQKDIQVSCYGYDWNKFLINNEELNKFIGWNDIAINSETEELLTALGGMSQVHEAFWNQDNKDYAYCGSQAWILLSVEDQLEAYFELIDALHFHFNKGLAIGIDVKSIRYVFDDFDPDQDQPFCMLNTLINKAKHKLEYHLNLDIQDLCADNEALRQFIFGRDFLIRQNQENYLNALGGNNGAAFWKPWKSAHKITMDSNIELLPNSELNNAKLVWLNGLELFLQKAVAIGMTPQLIVDLYFSKNKENRARQARGNY